MTGILLDDRYRLEERIGGGGMGDVYRGRHLLMEQEVAIKLLRPDLARDPTATRRFAREAKSTFRLDHPHCVRVTDFGTTAEGSMFLVMEYLTGRTAAQELEVDGPLDVRRAVHIARQVCAALAHAHELGLVHRDIKPDNIMLLRRSGDPDYVKVLDFGLAKLLGEPQPGQADLRTAALSMSPLTREGMVFGTPEYMSPEQAVGQPLSPATDIYSLGATLYELLTGQPPIQGDSFMEVLTKQVQEVPVPPGARRPDLQIPEAVESLVMACLAKAPEARPVSARALVEQLTELERSLEAARSRVPEEVAASATIDLGADAVARAADDQTSASYQATQTAQVAQAPGRQSWGTTAVVSAARTPGVASSAASRTGRRPRSAWLPILALAGAGTLAAILIMAATRSSTPDMEVAAAAPGEGSRSAAAQPAGPRPADSAGAAAPAAASPGTTVAQPADRAPEPPNPVDPVDPAASAAAGPRAPRPAVAAAATAETTRPSPALDPDRARLQLRVKQHLDAAEAAQRQGNRLKQLVEADSALQLDPGSREGAFLLGEALVGSGDKDKGCKYLQRARRLPRAREAYRRAGCRSD